jgi:hypothetical protein
MWIQSKLTSSAKIYFTNNELEHILDAKKSASTEYRDSISTPNKKNSQLSEPNARLHITEQVPIYGVSLLHFALWL